MPRRRFDRGRRRSHSGRRSADGSIGSGSREDLNCEPAFWAQLSRNFPYVARRRVISSKNFAGFVSLHNFPSGRAIGNHWGPAISVFETTSQTAYYYNHHIRDIGNFTVVGPSGSGKTVVLVLHGAGAANPAEPESSSSTRIAARKSSSARSGAISRFSSRRAVRLQSAGAARHGARNASSCSSSSASCCGARTAGV